MRTIEFSLGRIRSKKGGRTIFRNYTIENQARDVGLVIHLYLKKSILSLNQVLDVKNGLRNMRPEKSIVDVDTPILEGCGRKANYIAN